MRDEIFIKHLSEGFIRKSLGDKIPEGCCFSVCFPFSVLFSLLDIEHAISFGRVKKENITIDHFWIRLGNKETILEPTIGQFKSSNEIVYLGNIFDNEITRNYVADSRNIHEVFDEVYESWAGLLCQSEQRLPRSKDFEVEMISLNLKMAIVLIQHIEEFGLKPKLSQSTSSDKYFRTICSCIKSKKTDNHGHTLIPENDLKSILTFYERI